MSNSTRTGEEALSGRLENTQDKIGEKHKRSPESQVTTPHSLQLHIQPWIQVQVQEDHDLPAPCPHCLCSSHMNLKMILTDPYTEFPLVGVTIISYYLEASIPGMLRLAKLQVGSFEVLQIFTVSP